MSSKESRLFEYFLAFSIKFGLEIAKRIVGIILSICLLLLIILKDDPKIIKAYGDIFYAFLSSSTLPAVLTTIVIFLFILLVAVCSYHFYIIKKHLKVIEDLTKTKKKK